MSEVSCLKPMRTFAKMRESAAHMCLIAGCKAEENNHTPECREEQDRLYKIKQMFRELLDEVRYDLGDGKGVEYTIQRLRL